MWPFDRPSLQSVEQKLDRLLSQQQAILQKLGLPITPLPRTASPSSPVAKLTPAAIHVLTRQDVLDQEHARARADARSRAGLGDGEWGKAPEPEPTPPPSPPPPPASAPPPAAHAPLTPSGGFAPRPPSAPDPTLGAKGKA
jgi:hypothetical protein